LLEDVDGAIRSRFHNGLPLHLSCPEKSAIRVMNPATYATLCETELQDIFARQHIFVKGYGPTKTDVFDENNLSSMGSLTRPLQMHGTQLCLF
jgi:hypothetical protein